MPRGAINMFVRRFREKGVRHLPTARWAAAVLTAGALAAGCTAAAAHGRPEVSPDTGVIHDGASVAGPGSVGTGARSTTSPPLATEQVDVNPLTATSVSDSQYVVVESGMLDTCAGDTLRISGAFRCFGGDGVSDPCWSDPADPAVPHMICLLHPWDTTAYRYTLRAGSSLPTTTAAPQSSRLPAGDPWAVQLESGRRCMVLPDLQESFQGTPEYYYCGSDLSLLRGFDRSQPSWTVRSVKTSSINSLGTLGVERIATAWYGVNPAAHTPVAVLPASPRV